MEHYAELVAIIGAVDAGRIIFDSIFGNEELRMMSQMAIEFWLSDELDVEHAATLEPLEISDESDDDIGQV